MHRQQPRRAFSNTHCLRSQPSPRFSYSIAASFIAKDHPYDPSQHIFHFNPYNRINQTKGAKNTRPNSGHDAFFVSRVGDSGAVAFGVADGVGGWVDSGVDPADFSHSFCHYMAAAAYEHIQPPPGSRTTPNDAPATRPQQLPPLAARDLIQAGYDAVCRDRSVRAGGSTACVAVASPTGILDVANLGDSGFVQVRLGAVHAASAPQTHGFNTPFQLSVVPPAVAARMAAFGGAQLCDLPRDADVASLGVRHGDVLILASDGVWDNLFNQDVLRVVARVMTGAGAWTRTPEGDLRVAPRLREMTAPPSAGASASSLQGALATEITAAAKAASVNTKMDGPFAKAVQKYYPGENWRGGKVDDICVVVAVVSAEPAEIRSKL